MITLILIISVITITYYVFQHRYNYWKRKGVAGPTPRFLVGNIGPTLLLKKSLGQLYTEIYQKYENHDLVGLYRTVTPVLMVRDPELVKEVTVKSFSHFQDNDFYLNKKDDPLFGRNIFTLKGDEWKLVRSQLSPGFSAAKIKSFYSILENSGIKLIKYIESKPEITNVDGCDIKELVLKLMLNNVADVAFGLDSKCFEQENSSFRQLANDFFSPGNWTVLCFSLLSAIPSLSKILNLRFITKKCEDKLISLIKETVKYREENNVNRNDFLNVIMQLKKTSKEYEFTDVDITAHSAAFFFDGYETSSLLISFCLLEIARNTGVQIKLRREIDKVFDENGGKIPYEFMQSLPYLDAIVNETLRVYTPLFVLQKVCTKTFTFPAKNGRKAVTVEKDTPILIPVHGLHQDPKYYENPEKFMPERFLSENKDKMTKYTFLPLGEGPRACIGQRFGILQVKVGIAYIIRNYEVSVNEKMKFPLKFDILNTITSVSGKIWLNLKKIEM